MSQTNSTPFSLRPPTMDDLHDVVQFENDHEEAQTGLRPVTAEDIQRRWTSPGFDLAQSARLAENKDGKICGYATFWDTDDLPVDPWLNLRVHPAFKETTVGQQLLAWGEKRAQSCLERVPTDTRVILVTGTLHTNTASKTLFAQNGFIESRHFWEMKINLDQAPPDPVWPEGMQLFHYQTKEEILANLEKIIAVVDGSFQDHFGYVKRPLEQEIKRWRHSINSDNKRFDPTLWFLAMDGDKIAAVCLCLKEDHEDPNNGHVNILGVLRPYRRKGLGIALLHHAFQEYYQRGKTAVTLGVDANSLTNATQLYEKAGMHVHKQFDAYEKELRPGKDIVRRT